MGNRSKRSDRYWHGKIRARRDHARKRRAKEQHKHLLTIKGGDALRKMVLNSKGKLTCATS